MTRFRRLALTSLLSAGAVALSGAVSLAQTEGDSGTGNVSATVSGLTGAGRSIASVGDVTLASAGGNSLSGSLAVNVTEDAADGANGWYVTLQATDLTAAANTISASNMSVSSRSTIGTGVALGVTTTDATGSDTLDAERTLFTVNGETPGSIYTGAFAHTADVSLDVPNGTAEGAYGGTVTVTIYE